MWKVRNGVACAIAAAALLGLQVQAAAASGVETISGVAVRAAARAHASGGSDVEQPSAAPGSAGKTRITTSASAGAGWTVPKPALYPSGGVFSFGDAFSPSANLADLPLGTLIVSGAATPENPLVPSPGGLYLAGSNGSVYTFGDAVYRGSLGGLTLGSASFPAPIVAMAVTPDGRGYYLAGSNGSVYTFGDAVYRGSLGGLTLGSASFPAPIVAMSTVALPSAMATQGTMPGWGGYYLAGANGSVYTFGDAVYRGSLGGVPLERPGGSGNAVSAMVTQGGIGYWLIEADGTVSSPNPSAGGIFSFGSAEAVTGQLASVVLSGPAVAVAGSPAGAGLWLADAGGQVVALGGAPSYGSLRIADVQGPIVAMSPTPDGKGYYLAGANGWVYPFGDAVYRGSLGGLTLGSASFPAPIVAMAVTPDGRGYYLAGANGSVYTFGDAVYRGSLGGLTFGSASFPAPIVAMAVTPDGRGYYLAGSNGSVYTFGDAVYRGSLGGLTFGSASFPAPIVAMAVTPDGRGYYLAGANGSVYTFGDAVYQGSLGGAVPDVPTSGMAVSNSGGYWLLSPEGIRTAFPSPGGEVASSLGESIVQAAAGQVAPAVQPGTFCNPYGPCEPWCALFATWAFQQAGVQIPRYPFVGSVYDWGASQAMALPPSALPQPGDAILYGTGSQTVGTAVHMGIVAQVWPDGFIDTIEGDAGPGNNGEYGVIMNGPFLPSFSSWYNGFPVFAYVEP